jgi:hypothetical protein
LKPIKGEKFFDDDIIKTEKWCSDIFKYLLSNNSPDIKSLFNPSKVKPPNL